MPRRRKPAQRSNDPNLPRRAVFYARVSTEEQASKEHFSIPAQLQEMQSHAEQRNWQVVATFVDEGISGTTDKRPGFQAALDLIHRKEANLLVVHDLSRLARSIYITLDTIHKLDDAGASLVAVSQPDFDFSTPMGRMMLHMLAMLNQYYVDMLRVHIAKAKRERAREGFYNASVVPYGYRHVGGPRTPPEIVPEEAEIVRLAFQEYATGRFSDQDIADRLNTAGYVRHPTRKYPNGAPFTNDNVSTMLKNPFYKGKIYYSGTGEVFDGRHQAIVDESLWEKCQEVRARRRGASRAIQQQYRAYLLSLLGHCDVCGISLRAQTIANTETSYYRELSRNRGRLDCPHQQIGTRVEPVDRQVDAIIRAIHLPEDWLQQAQEQLGDAEELVRIQRQREELLARRRRLRRLFLEGDFGDDIRAYQQARDEIERQLQALPSEEQLLALRQSAETIRDLPAIWQDADTRDRSELLRLMLRRVDVDVAQSRVTALYPQIAFIPIFREVPILREREFGVFVPLWPPELAAWQDDPGQRLFKTPPLSPVTALPEHRTAPPFLLENFLAPSGKTRIDRGISKALNLYRKSGGEPRTLVQIEHPSLPPLPMDARKWPALQTSLVPAAALEPDTADVLVGQFHLWHTGWSHLQGDLTQTLGDLYAALRPGGMLYLQDLLPLDMAAHWLYGAFPALWELVRQQRSGIHTLYGKLLDTAFTIRKIQRQVRYQPVRADAALEIARLRPALLAHLDDAAFQRGLDDLAAQGDALLPSEVAVVEVWAQKEG